MLTLRAAAALLAATGPDALSAIAAVCGCDGPPLTLPAADRATLGLPAPAGPDGITVQVARGPGAVRAVLVNADGVEAAPLARDLVSRVAARLTRTAPHLAWLCVASGRGEGAAGSRSGPVGASTSTRQLIVATWSAERSPPRVAALVVDPAAIVDSDAETLAMLAAAAGRDGATMHARWLDLLGREALTRRFYRALEGAVGDLAASMAITSNSRQPSPDLRRDLALVYVSRLLFLAFLEAKGWLDRDRGFLTRIFGECVARGGRFHASVLRPLFFGTLNTPAATRSRRAADFGVIPFLNGGLFATTPLERRLRAATFSDAALGAFIHNVLSHYRFTAREDRSTWSEAAIDPEMLGRSFEALMLPSVRRATGAFYTPHRLVSHIAEHALTHALASRDTPRSCVVAALRGEPVDAAARQALRHRASMLRVLDPACGSGAFLVHMLELLATLAGHLGDGQPVSERRRRVLTRSIFGVDINPTAVWLCELRLWLAVVIESPETEPGAVVPLPNLDRNVRVGDALAGGALGTDRAEGERATGTPNQSRNGTATRRLRERYTRATGSRKRAILQVLERIERGRAVAVLERELAQVRRARLDAVTVARGRDLFGAPLAPGSTVRARAELRRRARQLRARLSALRDGAALPFAFATHFGDVDEAGGFDLVVGNPPWVRPHAVAVSERERLRRDFVVCRDGAWARGARASRAGSGFANQVDLAAMFAERALTLARRRGIVALLLPAKLWRCLAGGGLRRLIAQRGTLLRIEDWSGGRAGFDATAYPSLLILRHTDESARAPGATTPEGLGVASDVPTNALPC